MRCRVVHVLLALCIGFATMFSVTATHAAAAGAHSSVTAPPTDPTGCRKCHAEEVDGFQRSKMAQSMRLGGQEPEGVVKVPGTVITMSNDTRGSWQNLQHEGNKTPYHVDYVIGSGTHASGYVVNLGGHLFQSPVAYYRSRAAYDLAPGYEGKPDPDFTRPIGEGCVFCHAGSFDAIPGTLNAYAETPFPHLSIGCSRCHGDATAHLLKPGEGNIVNPPHLEQAARDSVCEQCHLIGIARVLNPGKRFTDFKPGQRLEETFTIYHEEAPGPPSEATSIKVISHSEQLAMSTCKRNSGGRMWCGTCHDPHNEPSEPVSYYRERCMLCHAKTTLAQGHPSRTSDCIGCHMPKRSANDGGHTAFTDHRIQSRVAQGSAAVGTVIAPWRRPPIAMETRNLGIANVEVGVEKRSARNMVDGYRMLTQVQGDFPEDSDLFNTMGSALLIGRQFGEAVQAFELAVRFDPGSSAKEGNLGQAYAGEGRLEEAERHLERAMAIDPLNLSAASLLGHIYDERGEAAKSEAMTKTIAGLIQTKPRGR